MNSESEGELNYSPKISKPSSDTAPKKRRRWWIYLLIGFGSIVVIGLIAIVCIATYYHSLIKNYTSTVPKPLPAVETSKEKTQDLAKRWQIFCDDVFKKQANEPFKLTTDDLNQLIGNFRELRNNLRVEITNDLIKADMMFPLDSYPLNSGRKELKGRYLNATVNLKLQLENGFLTLRVQSATANGKPVPKWTINRINGKNLLENLENNYDFTELLQQLEDVKVKDGQILFIPLNQGK